MICLKYVDNPFDDQMMNSISCFSEEKSFYDCVNRRFLDEQAFQHLEHSFYTYFLTGDCGEWIGYVLLSNENRVNGYYRFAFQKTLDLLKDFRNKFGNSVNAKALDYLEKLINKNSGSPGICVFLEEAIISLKKMVILENLNSFYSVMGGLIDNETLEKLKDFMLSNYNISDISVIVEELFSKLNQLKVSSVQIIDQMISDYYLQLQQYLVQFPNYLYLDVVIALPKEEKISIQKENRGSNLNVNQLAELKYYGFIAETFAKVEEEIQQNFNNIPIFLGEENKNVFLVNAETLSSNELVKQLQLTV